MRRFLFHLNGMGVNSMAEQIYNSLPTWAKPYAPTGGAIEESFNLGIKLTALNEAVPIQTVNGSFTVGFDSNKPPTVSRSATVIYYSNPQDVKLKATANTVIINKPVGIYGVSIVAKSYKKDEVQYMRQFPTDSFPLGIVSLDKAGKSVKSQKLQYGKQLVIASEILQVVTTASYLSGSQNADNLAGFTLDTVNGRLYYPDISVDIGLLTIFQSCILSFITDVTWR